MASPISQKLEEKLVCSICLELFRVPVTLPCRQKFCKRCISDHRHKQEQAPAGAEKGYTCPACRRGFKRHRSWRRMSPCAAWWSWCRMARHEPRAQRDGRWPTASCARSTGARWSCTVRMSSDASAASAPSSSAGSTGGCSLRKSTLKSRWGQWVAGPGWRALRGLLGASWAAACCTAECWCLPSPGSFEKVPGKSLRGIREDRAGNAGAGAANAQRQGSTTAASMPGVLVGACWLSWLFPTQDSFEGLKLVILSKFALLRKALEDCHWRTVARIKQEQVAVLGCMGEDWSLLRDHLDVLGQHRERAQCLLACPDHRTFLQEFPLLPFPESLEGLLPMEFDVAGMVKPITEILINISRLLLEDLPSSVAPKAPQPVGQGLEGPQGLAKVVAPLPECQLQAELLKGAGPHFEPRQVLCTQGCGRGHHYWEISSHSVTLGVTYRSLPWKRQHGHKFNIGLDGGSWGLQVWEDCYLAWHKGQAEKIQERLYKNLGVSLDYGKGLLSFYGLGERTWLIHSFHVSTKPFCPVCWLCERQAVTLCQRD
ncbi:hypothetical protein QYF61_012271 [Mycteria americana]|uniref:Uncharacterized protein n=1 Tax=Mycteria americana TaxID=33587 RepID=A0AAN7NJ76_MYCAM|nr:hypothetical protein QYF61_012271 [Mycteria americana]